MRAVGAACHGRRSLSSIRFDDPNLAFGAKSTTDLLRATLVFK